MVSAFKIRTQSSSNDFYRQFQNSLFKDNNCSSPSLSHFLLCLLCLFPAETLMSCAGISTYFEAQSVIKETCEISLSSLGWGSGLNAFTLSPATKISAALCGRHQDISTVLFLDSLLGLKLCSALESFSQPQVLWLCAESAVKSLFKLVGAGFPVVSFLI